MAKKTFYEVLPFFYSACGVATLILSDETTGKISGLLLISAAMIVFRLRLEYRKRRAEDAEEKLYRAQLKLENTNKSQFDLFSN
jgi:multisubunit Na+/H+ antiporter MnhC subunit